VSTKIERTPGIPPVAGVNFRASVEALKMMVDKLSGAVGPNAQRAVRVCELVDAGLLKLLPDGQLGEGESFNDSNYVHRTGDETVGGVKTFTNKLVIDNGTSGISGGHLSLRNTTGYQFDIGMGASAPTDTRAFLVNRHASGSIGFYTGSPTTLRGVVDAAGAWSFNGDTTIDCSGGTTYALRVLQPGSSPASSFVQVSSPNGAPGIIAQVGTTKRRDIRFTSTTIELSASSSTAAGTNNVSISESGDVTAAGAFVDALGRVRYAPLVSMTANINAQSSYSNRHVVKTVNGALQFSLQPNATVATDVSIWFIVTNDGSTTGNITIARGAGVQCFRNGLDGNITLTPGQSVILSKIATDRWQALT